jgi:AAA15 family ATPase/GTPase
MLENLEIKNFRGFDSLKVEGLSKINLFVGKNNSGKTSVLEALSLLAGMSNPQLPGNINLMRGLGTLSPTQFKYLFHKLKYENKPFFNGIFSDASERRLELDMIFQQQNNAILSTLLVPEIVGLNLNFSEKKNSDKMTFWQNKIVYGANGVNQELSNNYNENLFTTHIYPIKNDLETLRRYSEIVKRNENDDILDMLKQFDENIVNVQPLPDGIFVRLKDTAEQVPINVMGDGIRRFLEIVTAVVERKNILVLIDEIENGLHYSFSKQLWKSLITYSQKYDSQLFITTHNIETLQSLKSVLKEEQYQEMRDFSKVFSISKTAESEYKAYRFSYDEFKIAIENKLELRE